MIDKHFQRSHRLISIFFVCAVTALISLLVYQYRFFCVQARQLVLLQKQYYKYLDAMHDNDKSKNLLEDEYKNDSFITMEEISCSEHNEDPDEDEYAQGSFLIINRELDYLKQSTLDYVQDQELDSLMTRIDMSQWSHDMQKRDNTSVIEKKNPVRSATNVPAKTQVITKKPINDCGLSWPIDKDKFWLSSLYGPRKRINGTWGFHHGIDMAAVKGTAIKAARSGRVTEAGFQSGYGNTIVIQHTSHLKTRYAHLHTIKVSVGQAITSGMIIGTVGETGFIRKKGKDGSHLHFEVYEKGERVNPLHCLP